MMGKFLLLYLYLSLFGSRLTAQDKFAHYDFAAVDSFALTVEYEKDIYKLAKDLATPYTEEVYKVRSIFRWITNNIEYDYKFINKDKEIKGPDCEGKINCADIVKAWEEDFLRDVLKSRKTICFGYSRLFKKLCEINGIKAEIVSGYTKSRPYQIGNTLSPNHAWNAVMLDSVWYYLDPTWAAGYVAEDEESGKLMQYKKVYKNYYWFTPFSRLARNHYPKNGRWVDSVNLTKEKFFNMPHYYGLGMLEKISNERSPASGVIEVKTGDTIHFKFDYTAEFDKLQINSNIFTNPPLWSVEEDDNGRMVKRRDTFAIKKQVYLPYSRKGNTLEFDYVVQNQSLYYLELLFDYKKALRYKVKVLE